MDFSPRPRHPGEWCRVATQESDLCGPEWKIRPTRDDSGVATRHDPRAPLIRGLKPTATVLHRYAVARPSPLRGGSSFTATRWPVLHRYAVARPSPLCGGSSFTATRWPDLHRSAAVRPSPPRGDPSFTATRWPVLHRSAVAHRSPLCGGPSFTALRWPIAPGSHEACLPGRRNCSPRKKLLIAPIHATDLPRP